MKHVTKQLFSVAMLLSVAFTQVRAESSSHTFNASRSVLPAYRSSNFTGNGLLQQANHCCKESDSFSAQLSAGIEYSHSMSKDKLANYFTPGTGSSITFGTEGGAKTDIFSANFFLPVDHVSTLTFNPKFYALNADFGLHVGLHEFVEGAWLSVDLPVVHAVYDLGLKSAVTTAGTTAGIGERFGAGTPTFPYTDPIAALHGDKTITDADTVVTAPLTYGKYGTKKEGTRTRVGNVTIALGMDVINKDNVQLGLGVLGLVNGDEAADAKFVNKPVIGTGGRHGVGARLDGSVRLWENNESTLSAHVRVDGAYIFNATVRRSFDITGHGVMSRYLLLAKHSDFNSVTTITNAINVTSLQVKAGKFGYYDANLMLSLTHKEWEVNVGYNLGGQTKEKLHSFVDTIPATAGYTFFAYTNAPVATADNAAKTATKVQIDGSEGTKGTAAATVVTMANAADLNANALTETALIQDSGLQPNTMGHRVYGNIGYCYDSNEWMPFLSIGGSAEFSSGNSSVKTWGVHATGGISF